MPTALEHCIDSWRSCLPFARLTLTIDGTFDDLDHVANLTIYRLVQEGLTNVSKFAGNARVEIFLARGQCNAGGKSEVMLTITDDGPGTDLSAWHAGAGLIDMQEHINALGGEFHVASPASGGFVVCARLLVRATHCSSTAGFNEPPTA